jgi:hypothetical protein
MLFKGVCAFLSLTHPRNHNRPTCTFAAASLPKTGRSAKITSKKIESSTGFHTAKVQISPIAAILENLAVKVHGWNQLQFREY